MPISLSTNKSKIPLLISNNKTIFVEANSIVSDARRMEITPKYFSLLENMN
jgi:hypothetical protein